MMIIIQYCTVVTEDVHTAHVTHKRMHFALRQAGMQLLLRPPLDHIAAMAGSGSTVAGGGRIVRGAIKR